LEYRLASRSGLKISALSFGCMRFADAESAAATVRKAIELGVNYFDVAPAYGGGTAEPWLAAGLKGLRDKAIVTAKSGPGDGGAGIGEEYRPAVGFGIRSADQARTQIERSMKILGVDHLDVYQLWSCSSDVTFNEALKPGGFLEGVRKAQSEGLFDHLGITGHADSDTMIRWLSDYDFDLVTIPFQAADTSRARFVQFCAERGIGVIAMNPLAGGHLARVAGIFPKIALELGCETMVEAALRFLVEYPGVTTALCGLTYPEQVEEGVKAAGKGALAPDIASDLESRVWEVYSNVKHLCTGCGYCGDCPEGILIPKVLEMYTKSLVPSLSETAFDDLVQKASENPKGYDPSGCVACKECEKHCPNGLPISQLMSDAADRWPKLD